MNIKLTYNTISNDEIKEVIKILKTKQFTQGKKVSEFEKKFAKKIGSKYAVMVNSGSSANLLGYSVLVNPEYKNTNKNSEIIVPALSWSTSVWPIIQLGFKPVFVDCKLPSLQMDLEAVKRSINKNTIGICAVHVLGGGCQISELSKIAKKNKLWLIEDTCESLGASYNYKSLGTFGNIGTFSFYFSHHITTIEGGMLVTNDKKIYELALIMRSHGWIRDLENKRKYIAKNKDINEKYMFVNTGYNLRSTEINAAIGIEQLKKLSKFNTMRSNVTKYLIDGIYKKNLDNFFDIMLIEKNINPSWFGFPIICKTKIIKKKLEKILDKSNIQHRPVICGNMAKQPALKIYDYKIYQKIRNANIVMQNGIYIGISPSLKKKQLDYILETLEKIKT